MQIFVIVIFFFIMPLLWNFLFYTMNFVHGPLLDNDRRSLLVMFCVCILLTWLFFFQYPIAPCHTKPKRGSFHYFVGTTWPWPWGTEQTWRDRIMAGLIGRASRWQLSAGELCSKTSQTWSFRKCMQWGNWWVAPLHNMIYALYTMC